SIPHCFCTDSGVLNCVWQSNVLNSRRMETQGRMAVTRPEFAAHGREHGRQRRMETHAFSRMKAYKMS
ncbi:MAG: hypothetical protein IJS08_12355, partial [Victivallales bacterium]|nr:hypothetical protein [Victivallales bacterium]